ncbi:MAG: beta-ketoacyl-[acyl-carrier-protein] synthase family protein [Methylobacterium sp.]|uniref:beta-ketoacyl-[acyl-carrier-protein] synthase family protein n=1 Tax=Methylobacterium sp. TaxID=409 RepID=UPI0025F048F3|nr:beta-ketoacyl-[acyl-carrier-protein] synthase family protein [Methylobacterium sp.]MBX9934334.1 beta-ketoacyl-[acyl-carrier-protein] synthase family protein [Methylobacterium sp.]
MTTVVVSGIGVVAPNGLSVDPFWLSLIGPTPALGETSVLPGSGLTVAEISDTEIFRDLGVSITACDRSALFALAATRQAMLDAGLPATLPNPERVAVIIGNGAGGQCTMDEQYVRLYGQNNKRLHPMTVARAMVSSSASWISIATGARGPCFVVSSACASSTHAIGLALQFLRGGLADIVITGGCEAPLSVGTIRAWESMRIMSRTACRPFAAGRDGLILSEGAGILVLETAEHAVRRGHRTAIEVAGFASNADAGDIVAPSAAGMAGAMRQAIADAGVRPEDVAYINAHGTGTTANDRTEAEAMKSVFGALSCPPVSSTKGVTGHALGAAGALEAIATVLAMTRRVAPPTANFDAFDPSCDLDCIPNVARPLAMPVAMSNSFAFGGLNASLVFKAIV